MSASGTYEFTASFENHVGSVHVIAKVVDKDGVFGASLRHMIGQLCVAVGLQTQSRESVDTKLGDVPCCSRESNLHDLDSSDFTNVSSTLNKMEMPVDTQVAPVEAQVVAPVEAQVVAPVEAQVVAPVEAQVVAPVEAQVVAPVEAQVVAPVDTQVAPVEAQVVAPVEAQVVAPVEATVVAQMVA
jgi:hypothetical protein